MKWLAAFLCLLAMPALAEERLPPGTIQLPSSLVCGPYNPTLGTMGNSYGEIPFVEGYGDVLSPDISKSYQGKVRIFLDPKDGSFTIFLDLGEQLTCLVTSGVEMQPYLIGEPL